MNSQSGPSQLKPIFGGLTIKIVILQILLVTLTVLISSWSSYELMHASIKENKWQSLHASAIATATFIGKVLDDQAEATSRLLAGDEIKKYRKSGNELVLNKYLATFRNHFYQLSYFTEKRELISSLGLEIPDEESQSLLIRAAEAPNQIHFSDPHYIEPAQAHGLHLSYQAVDYFDQIVGAVVSTVLIRDLILPLQNLILEESEFYLILDENSKIVYSPNSQLIGTQFKTKLHRASAGKEYTGLQETTIEGVNCFISVADIPKHGWKVVKAIPHQAFYLSLNKHQNISLIIAFVVILLGISLGYLIACTITKPIKKLALITSRVSDGDFSVSADIESNDELGQLGASVDQMSRSLKQSRDRDKNYLSHITQSIQDSLIATSKDGKIKSVNPAALALLEYQEQDLLGLQITDLLKQEQEQEQEQEQSIRFTDITMDDLLVEDKVKSNTNFCITRSGRKVPVLVSRSALLDDSGQHERILIVLRDMTEDYKTRKILKHQATHDALTGLANRTLLADRFNQAVNYAHRFKNKVIVALIDLDNFKYVNDVFGHPVGDALLMTVADRLQLALRSIDTVARLGGDEFALILTQQKDSLTRQLVNRILTSIAEPIHVEGKEFSVTCSLGYSSYPDDGKDAETLLKLADIAMYQAKSSGRNTYKFYTKQMQLQLSERMDLEEKLREAYNNKKFALYFQPKVSLRTGKMVGAEALIRWTHDQLGGISPDRFIPLAEEIGLIIPIDQWVVGKTCEIIKHWHNENIPVVPVAINLSAFSFIQKDLDLRIEEILATHGIDESQIVLEITETSSMKDPEQSLDMMLRLAAKGFKLSVDDFGSGYSNLSYLRKFPIDSIKIDRTYITDMHENPMDFSIVNAIIKMADSLGMRTIAEGVENESQLALLAASGCTEMQGYYFSKPIPADDFKNLLCDKKAISLEKLARKLCKRSILFIDDEPIFLSLLRHQLSKFDAELFFAGSAEEALEILAQNDISVVCSDHEMPQMSGIELLQKIKNLYPMTVRILMSGSDDRKTVISAINSSKIFKFIVKPFDSALLESSLESALQSHDDRLRKHQQ